MPAERYYADVPLAIGDRIEIEGQEFHHLSHVMRSRIGQEIEVINGRNELAIGTLEGKNRHSAQVLLQSFENRFDPSRKQVILAQAFPRLNRLEFILEKGTELGVTEFWLFPGALSEKEDYSANQQQRMKLILISAMKQCGRLDLPLIQKMPPLQEWQNRLESAYFGDTRSESPHLCKISLKSSQTQPTIFFIGPEKGFHADEISILENKLGVQGVRLHENILRVDTAPLAALVLLSAIIPNI